VIRHQPILAIDRVRYVGEPVAAVAAEDPAVAAEALGLVEVEYEDLPAVFSVDEALEQGAPLLHEGPPPIGAPLAADVLNLEAATNLCNHFKIRKGDVDRGLDQAEHIFEDVFTTPAMQHMALEPHACVAEAAGDRMILWDGTQTPYRVRDEVAEILGIPAEAVRLFVPTLGGAYGNKCHTKIEPLVVVLAQASGRPVKLVLTREEDSVALTRHPSRVSITSGLDREGRIVARRCECWFDTGAYADIGPRVIRNGGFGAPGPYSIPNVWVDSYAVYTNHPPAGAFRGYGIPQAAWAHESHMDMIAERLELDPYELRMRNLLVEGASMATGERIEDCRFRDLLERAAAGIGWDPGAPPERRGNRVRAKGLSCIMKGVITPSVSECVLELDGRGDVRVLTSSVEMGQGLKTALAILAAEQVGVPVREVEVSTVDTDVTPYDQQTSSSRSTFCMGNALIDAARDLHEQIGGLRSAHDPERRLTLGELVAASGAGKLTAHGRFETHGVMDPDTGQGVAAANWSQAAAGAEVEVDLETGRVDLLRYLTVVHAGRVVNPVQAELQTEGNIAFGIGQTLFEEMVFDHGQLANPNLSEYLIPSMADMRRPELEILEDEERGEIHGLGETALPAVSPAIANALSRATGCRITALPITPEKVLTQLRAQ
jgi:CO/xanthine dehydrogenase Mo-binding subunit